MESSVAITNIAEYAHLTDADIETLGRELDAIRLDIEEQLGERDARYIRRVIAWQRGSEVAARLILAGSRHRPMWWAGTVMLAGAKIVENMELAHNISHGQWDWMNDPEIHSATWEWDQVGPSAQWKTAHNYTHHYYTNIVGMDDDIGFGILRMTRDVTWRPTNLLQPLANILLAVTFEWGIARHDLDAQHRSDDDRADHARSLTRKGSSRAFHRKIARQMAKDFVVFPALTGRAWKHTLTANATANLIRNLWAYVVIFCGHFPDGAEKFTRAQFESETSSEWYLRQMLGSANFKAGPLMAFASGHLCYQIEHHLFPDLPSNRYAQIAARLVPLCDKYDLPYTTGSLPSQYWLALRTMHKLALPDSFLLRDSDNAPETSSERRFAVEGPARLDEPSRTDSATDRRHGLRSALHASRRAATRARRRHTAGDLTS
jgi:fatty acid desaturase